MCQRLFWSMIAVMLIAPATFAAEPPPAAPGAADLEVDATSAVPAVRIGATLEECTKLLGEPKPSPPYLVFEKAGWRIVVSVYRGRVDHVTYRTKLGEASAFTTSQLYDLVAKPDATLVELRKLHGEKRKWTEVGADATALRSGGVRTVVANYRPTAAEMADPKSLFLPRITWRSDDGLLFHTFSVDHSDGGLTKVLTVSTQANRERREGTSDAIKMNRDDARTAWQLGTALTTLPGAGPTKAKDGFRDVGVLFASLRAAQAARVAEPELAAWDPPAVTGNAVKDRLALDNFLVQVSERTLKALGADENAPGEPAVAACFELGRNTPRLPIILLAGDAKLKGEYLDQLSSAATKSNIPKEVWEPLILKARGGASAQVLTPGTTKMFNDISKYLDGKRAEWKPKTRPVEK